MRVDETERLGDRTNGAIQLVIDISPCMHAMHIYMERDIYINAKKTRVYIDRKLYRAIYS